MPDARDALRWAVLDATFRTFPTILSRCASSATSVRGALQEMERRGEVEVGRGYGRAHGNSKSYRLAR